MSLVENCVRTLLASTELNLSRLPIALSDIDEAINRVNLAVKKEGQSSENGEKLERLKDLRYKFFHKEKIQLNRGKAEATVSLLEDIFLKHKLGVTFVLDDQTKIPLSLKLKEELRDSSRYFSALFSNTYKESCQNVIQLSDTKRAEFYALLNAKFKNEVPHEVLLEETLCTAHRYWLMPLPLFRSFVTQLSEPTPEDVVFLTDAYNLLLSNFKNSPVQINNFLAEFSDSFIEPNLHTNNPSLKNFVYYSLGNYLGLLLANNDPSAVMLIEKVCQSNKLAWTGTLKILQNKDKDLSMECIALKKWVQGINAFFPLESQGNQEKLVYEFRQIKNNLVQTIKEKTSFMISGRLSKWILEWVDAAEYSKLKAFITHAFGPLGENGELKKSLHMEPFNHYEIKQFPGYNILRIPGNVCASKEAAFNFLDDISIEL